MILSIQEENLTISKEFFQTEDHDVTPEEVLLGAYDIISRVFSEGGVVRAYYRTDPDTKAMRNPDDKILQMYEKYGLLAGKQKE